MKDETDARAFRTLTPNGAICFQRPLCFQRRTGPFTSAVQPGNETAGAERAPGLCLRQRPETRTVIRGRCHSRNAFRRAARVLRSRPSSRLQASPPRHPPRRQSGLLAVPTRDSPQGRQDSVRQAGLRPAAPKQKIAAFAVNPLQAASSLTAHSPQINLGRSVRLLLNYPVTLYFSILFYGLVVCLSTHLYRQQSY